MSSTSSSADRSGAGRFNDAARGEAAPLSRWLPEPLPADPLAVFRAWYDEAHRLKVQPNPNAMTLATIDSDGRPSARIVLCKGMDLGQGYLVFYTNYHGRKGRALMSNPYAALLFHWDDLDRQVRIEGPVVPSPQAENDAYFASRPWLSKVGAWASDQSEPIGSRRELEEKLDAAMRRFGIDPANPPSPEAEVDVPRPPHWGGFRVWAERVELWVGVSGRVHDRAVWNRTLAPASGGGYKPGAWTATRLQP